MAARHARIVHLAVADGRGHLMRAHLLRRLLADRGIAVDIVTTSEAGRGFLGRPGDAVRGVPGGFHVGYDDCHNVHARETRRRRRRTSYRPGAWGATWRCAAAQPGRAARGQRFAASAALIWRGWAEGGGRASSTCTATVCGGPRLATSTGGCPWASAAYRGLLARCAPVLRPHRALAGRRRSRRRDARADALPPAAPDPDAAARAGAVRRALGVARACAWRRLPQPALSDPASPPGSRRRSPRRACDTRRLRAVGGSTGLARLDPAFSDVVAAATCSSPGRAWPRWSRRGCSRCRCSRWSPTSPSRR